MGLIFQENRDWRAYKRVAYKKKVYTNLSNDYSRPCYPHRGVILLKGILGTMHLSEITRRKEPRMRVDCINKASIALLVETSVLEAVDLRAASAAYASAFRLC